MPNFCFENESLKNAFIKSGHSKDGCFTFEELINELSGFKKPIAQSLSSTEKTVELLREALILNAEHVEHCFSNLPPTPKNETLKASLLSYLETKAPIDWTNAIWQTTGNLKEKKIRKQFSPHWIFVKNPDSRFLFHELAKAFSYAPGVELVELKNLGNCIDVAEASPKPLQVFESASALTSLSEAIEESLKSHEKVLLSFAGKPEEEAFLSYRLKAKGITLNTSSLTHDTSLLNKIRNLNALPFLRRVELYHKLSIMKSGLPNHLEEKELLDKAVTASLLTEEEKQSILTAQSSPPLLSSIEERVILLPWVCPPSTSYPVFAFAGSDVLDFEFENNDLTPGELESLFLAGFPLPRRSEIREERLKVLEDLKNHGAALYTSLPVEELSGFSLEQKSREAFLTPSNQTFSKKLPTQTFSATQLETYAVCPTRYLFSNRFKLRRDPRGLEGLQLLHGQITHRAFELYFTDVERKEIESGLKHYFQVAIQETAPNLNEKHYAFRYLKLQYEKLIPRVLKIEKDLDTSFGPRKTLVCEKEFTLDIHGATFKGKIDRIDELSDGSLLVLDYKTGTIDFTPDHIRKGKHFQALLYLLGTEVAFSKPVAGMLFYDLKESEVRRGVLIEERVSKEAKKLATRGHTLSLEKYQRLVEEGLGASREITGLIEKGEFPPNPSSENCAYCDVVTFCRRAYGIQ